MAYNAFQLVIIVLLCYIYKAVIPVIGSVSQSESVDINFNTREMFVNNCC